MKDQWEKEEHGKQVEEDKEGRKHKKKKNKEDGAGIGYRD